MRPAAPPDSLTLHATAVALAGRAVLIMGASGSGKSALALKLMAFGATLVADDRVILTRQGSEIIASAPEAIRGQIEARFVGILKAKPAPPTPLALLITLDKLERERLPEMRQSNLLGVDLAIVHKCEGSHFAAAILQYLKQGRFA